MCGILGILNLSDKKISKINFMNMLDTLEHRGPDDTGYFDNDYISFGHKRLSIIDLSKKARQPMKSENGRYALIYNGEIYNYKKLRKILKNIGYKFKSESDTEVVLHAWQEWKEDIVEKLNGMFALAIWDNEYKKLFLARDRYGIKPLYYAKCDDFLYFLRNTNQY